MNERPDEDWVKMHLSDLTTPKTGRIVFADHYWVIVGEEALFFRTLSNPQANTIESIARRLAKSAKGADIVFIPLAYVPHRCNDYMERH